MHVARYGAEHKQATRQRIIEAAARRFKEDGIDGSGIAVLMADAGLTNGAFYAHFDSKDDLVAKIVAEELGAQYERLAALPPGREGLEAFVRSYLSPRHRDQPGTGCPSAALLDEIARRDQAAKRAYTTGARAIVNLIASRLEPANPKAARRRALGLYTSLVGSLQLSRAVSDKAFSNEVLRCGIENALILLG